MALSSSYRDGDLFSEALWVKWPIRISMPPLTTHLKVAPSSVSMHHFFCRFMHYGVSATAFTARCVSWAWINKTTPFLWLCTCFCVHNCACVFTEEGCAAVLNCTVCVFVSDCQQSASVFLSGSVIELNYLAWPRASTVNSVTVQFMPEICKESKEQRIRHAHSHTYTICINFTPTCFEKLSAVVIRRCNCQCACKHGFLTGLWRLTIWWVYWG